MCWLRAERSLLPCAGNGQEGGEEGERLWNDRRGDHLILLSRTDKEPSPCQQSMLLLRSVVVLCLFTFARGIPVAGVPGSVLAA
eukprot:768749-Hanusia_phi.AAC.8